MLSNTGLHVLFGSLVVLGVLGWLACLVFLLRRRASAVGTSVGYAVVIVLGVAVVAFAFVVVNFWSENS